MSGTLRQFARVAKLLNALDGLPRRAGGIMERCTETGRWVRVDPCVARHGRFRACAQNLDQLQREEFRADGREVLTLAAPGAACGAGRCGHADGRGVADPARECAARGDVGAPPSGTDRPRRASNQ